jgi:hypothetical protein
MIVNLKKINTAYINLPSYPNRNQSMINMLNHHGLNYFRVEGVSPNGEYGVPQAHLKALSTGADLILEDDCVPYEYREEVEFPDDADVVYLGVASGTTHSYTPKFKKISEEIYRIYDMTGLHAVLYVTEAGRKWLKDSYKMATINKLGMDFCTASLLKNIKAYGLNRPIWYQNDLREQTMLTLEEAFSFDDYSGGGYEDYSEPIQY